MKLFSLPSLALIAALMPIEPALAANAITVTLNPTNDFKWSGCTAPVGAPCTWITTFVLWSQSASLNR